MFTRAIVAAVSVTVRQRVQHQFNPVRHTKLIVDAQQGLLDRVFPVTWTRFVFNAANGAYVQSPIAFAYSTDGGATGIVLYGQGSRPTVGPTARCMYFGTVPRAWRHLTASGW